MHLTTHHSSSSAQVLTTRSARHHSCGSARRPSLSRSGSTTRTTAAAAVAAAAVDAAAQPRLSQQGRQRLFLDSADVKQWERWAPTGTLYGFTTNPLILDRDGVPCTLAACKQLLTTARRLGAQELQCQAWGGSADALEASALALLELDPEFLTVKVPCTEAGLKAAAAVLRTDPQVSLTITGVYKIRQALMAQAVGANYVAPYLGRIADGITTKYQQDPEDWEQFQQEYKLAAMESAIDAVAAMQAAVTATGSSMRVLVASIRSASDMGSLAARGCDTFTFSPSVMEQLCCVDETEAAAADFEAAAVRSQQHPPLAASS